MPTYYSGFQKLNSLSGSEWLSFTKSWFIHNPTARTEKIFHPATFPESIVEGFINFFTKEGDWVLDPFLGTGTTLVAAKRLKRHGVGIELYADYVNYAKEALSSIDGATQSRILQGDSRDILPRLSKMDAPRFSFCITSPPYWCQLMSNHERNQYRVANNMKTYYGNDKCDLGNITNYEAFLEEQKKIFAQVYEVARKNAYLVVITNNVYRNGRLYPLAFDTLRSLSELWVPKDEKIWCQTNKELMPFGMWTAWVGNRSHHYCLIFRKES